MTSRPLMAAGWAAILAFAALPLATQVSAKSRPPLVPTALVEDVKSSSAEVEFMDYVGRGQVIKLQPSDVLVLSYLRSCAHETITGGTVSIGAEQSEVEGGKITRNKVPCDGGKIQLTSAQANASGASSFRLQSSDTERTLHALPPLVQLPRRITEDRTLVIERTDRLGQRIEIKLSEKVQGGSFLDLSQVSAEPLVPGGTYRAILGGRKVTFKVHANAQSDSKTPAISRLLRLTPG